MEKLVIDKINKCYSVNALTMGEESKLIFAGEGDGSLNIYSGEKYENKEVVWAESEKLGGTMTICGVEDMEGCFFASTGFFTMIQSEASAIYLVRHLNGEYRREKVCDIPYLHRFDVLTVEGYRYLIACTLHSGKKDKDDWSAPGKILVAELPFDLSGKVSVKPVVLKDGLFQNHGFNRAYEVGKAFVLVAAKEGVFQVMPPQKDKKEWSVEQIFDFPASDVCALDLDGDGKLEYGIISPFHGEHFSVYKRNGKTAVKIYEHEKKLDFYHAIYADYFCGEPSFVIGARKEDMDLYRVFYNREKGSIETEVIEEGAGSSNARIVHTKAGDIIMSANRQKDEAAIFFRKG
ncbi:hypothetical protein D3Z45_01990 [Lachnospiraceae bacterium]|nr:hypothetical protein [Lachnospiraceae bacterium]